MLQKLAKMLDLGELLRRAVKYLVEGVMVAIAAYAIPKKSLKLDEVALIALTAAAIAKAPLIFFNTSSQPSIP